MPVHAQNAPGSGRGGGTGQERLVRLAALQLHGTRAGGLLVRETGFCQKGCAACPVRPVAAGRDRTHRGTEKLGLRLLHPPQQASVHRKVRARLDGERALLVHRFEPEAYRNGNQGFDRHFLPALQHRFRDLLRDLQEEVLPLPEAEMRFYFLHSVPWIKSYGFGNWQYVCSFILIYILSQVNVKKLGLYYGGLAAGGLGIIILYI